MPDDTPADEPTEAPIGAEPPTDETLYDGEPAEVPQQMRDLVDALQPTEEEYLPFDPAPHYPSVEEPSTIDAVDPEKPVEFDPRMREDFVGLLYIGALKKRFVWMGHEFLIRSLGTNDVIEAALLQQPYMGTMGEIKAYQAACVAACLISVDGQPMPTPITDEVTDTRLATRFRYVLDHYQPILIDVIYGELMKVEAKVNEVLAAMGKASG